MRLKALLFACAIFLSSNAVTYAETAQSSDDSVAGLITGMTRMGRCTFPEYSPDDKTICFVSNMSGNPELWTVPVGGGWPTQITFTKQPVIGECWSPNNDWIAFLAGAGNRELHVVKADGTGQRNLEMQGYITTWTHDGKNVFIGADGKSLMVNPVTGEAKVISNAGDQKSSIEDTTRDGKFALMNTWGGNGESSLFLLNLADGKTTELTPHTGSVSNWGGPCNRSRPMFSADGKTVYFVSNSGRPKAGFAKVRLSSDGKPGPIEYIASSDDAEVNGFAVDNDLKTAAVAWGPGKHESVDLIDLASGASKPLPGLPPQQDFILEISMAHSGSSVAVSAASKAAPTDVFVCSTAGGAWNQITHAQHPGVNLGRLVTPTDVSFTGTDGTTLKGKVLMPPGASGTVPFVITLSGLHNQMAENQALVACGMGVLIPELPRREDNDSPAIKAEKYSKGLAQLKDWVGYLVDKQHADAKHIGIQGTFGCTALGAIAEYPSLFAACVARSNWSDLPALLKNSSRKELLLKDYGTPETSKAIYDLYSPVQRFNNVKAAVLLQHGALDARTPMDQVDEAYTKLKAGGTPVEKLIFADEGDVVLKPDNEVKSTTSMIDFFVQKLEPENRITIR